MMPAISPERRGRREDGNVTFIETEFATRLRFLVIHCAQRAAKEAVIRKLRGEGKRLSLMSAGEIASLANAHLKAHAAELLAQAEASGVVQDLRQEHSRRAIDRAANSACGSPVRNGATIGPSINKDRGVQQ